MRFESQHEYRTFIPAVWKSAGVLSLGRQNMTLMEGDKVSEMAGPLGLVVLHWGGHFRVILWKTAEWGTSGRWQGCSWVWTSNWPYLATWPSCGVLFWKPPLHFEQIVCFSLHFQDVRFWDHRCVLFPVEKVFLFGGLVVAWVMSWQNHERVLNLCSLCVLKRYHISSRNE